MISSSVSPLSRAFSTNVLSLGNSFNHSSIHSVAVIEHTSLFIVVYVFSVVAVCGVVNIYKYLRPSAYLLNDCREIKRILIASINTAKTNR